MDAAPYEAAINLMPPPEIGFGSGTLSGAEDRKSTRLNSSHSQTSYAVFCLKKKTRGSGRPPAGSFRSSPPYHSFVFRSLCVGHGGRTSTEADPLCSIPALIGAPRSLISDE